MKRFLWLGSVVALFVICTGCGDVFRPIIIPNPPVFPNPQAAHTAVTFSDNGSISDGSAMVIDVSGDTDVSQKALEVHPVHAVQQSAGVVLVVNQSVPEVGADSVTKLSFAGTVIAASGTITLPISYDQAGNRTTSEPNFVATTEPNQAYVSMPQFQPNPLGGPFVPSVAVINTSAGTNVAMIPVGTTPGANPFAIAETPDGTKLYVANNGDGTVDGFNSIDRSSRVISGTFNSPLWVSARSDSQRVYVLNGNGVLSTLDTHLTAGPDTVIDASINLPGAAYMWYDTILNRLYVAQGQQQQMTILDVSQSVPSTLATIAIPSFALLPTGTVAPANAVAVTSLPDGSRAYVGSFAVLPSDFTISAVAGDGTTATYAYTLTSGHDLTAGVAVTVTGTGSGFDGTFLVTAIVSGTTGCPGTCFQAPNATTGTGTAGAGTGSNVFTQVTVVNAKSNTIKTTFGIPGFPDATDASSPYYVPICASARFRMNMAAGGDSTRTYLASCDGGNVNIVDTSLDAYVLNVPAPSSARAPIPPSTQNPPQNPVFMIAGP